MLWRRLIHSENQFSTIKKKFSKVSSCCENNLNLDDLPVLLIITTQRTGSTVLCQDIEQACQLNYSPTESFIPPLTYLFNNYPNHNPNLIKEILDRSFMHPIEGPIYIHKLMIDYIGWLGFLLAPKDFVKNASYVDLSIWAIKFIMSKTKNNLPLVFLNRKDKFAQASSRLINTFGLKTHLSTNQERLEFNEILKNKLNDLKHPEAMLLDQASIIIKQNDLLAKIYKDLSLNHESVIINYEQDICDESFSYLDKFLESKLLNKSLISRKLKKTANMNSNNLISSTKKILGIG